MCLRAIPRYVCYSLTLTLFILCFLSQSPQTYITIWTLKFCRDMLSNTTEKHCFAHIIKLNWIYYNVKNALRVLLRLFLHLKLFIASDRISQNIMIGLTCLSHILCRSDALLDSTSQISAVKNIFHPRAKNLTLRVLHFFCYVCYQSDKLSITLAKIETFKN